MHPELKTVLHTDQGAVYASKSLNELLPLYNIVHSMSRVGTPTDNAAMEAINGWIKAEIFNDFHLTGTGNIRDEVERYIVFFNEERPAYSLNYLIVANLRSSAAPRQSMRVLRYNNGSVSELLTRCKYFQVERLLPGTEGRKLATFQTGSNSFHALLCVDGCGALAQRRL